MGSAGMTRMSQRLGPLRGDARCRREAVTTPRRRRRDGTGHRYVSTVKTRAPFAAGPSLPLVLASMMAGLAGAAVGFGGVHAAVVLLAAASGLVMGGMLVPATPRRGRAPAGRGRGHACRTPIVARRERGTVGAAEDATHSIQRGAPLSGSPLVLVELRPPGEPPIIPGEGREPALLTASPTLRRT